MLPTKSRRPNVEWLDLAALVAAHLVALVSFGAAFSGAALFVAGGVGVFAAAIYWTWILRQAIPSWLAAVGAMVVFTLVGPAVVARQDAIGGFLPTPVAIGSVLNGVIHGWWTLVTTLPPVGQAGHVLAVPYLCGFAGVSASLLLARWRRAPLVAALPPIVVVGLGVLVGTETAGPLFLEIGLLLAIVLLWASTLDRRARPVIGSVRRGRGFVGSTALLAVVALVAGALGSHVPFAHSRARYVLRDRVQPPFDPNDHPSPLAAFRIYRIKENKNRSLLTVSGVTHATLLRIATMDDYDQLVWRDVDTGALDVFRRVGTSLPDRTKSATEAVTVTIDDARGMQKVWLPLIGQPSRIEFAGPRAHQLAGNLSYNVAQSTAAEQIELHDGDQFTLQTVIPADASLDGTTIAKNLPAASDQTTVAAFSDKAGTIVKGASDPRADAAAIKLAFSRGAYDDGPIENTPPGHFLARIAEFLRETQPVGNAEQYAAAAAILLHARQIPARVVLGVKLTAAPRVTYQYKDVTAWIEIPVAGRGWVAYDVTPSVNNRPKPQPKPKDQKASSQPPPQPPRAALSASSGSAGSTQSTNRHTRRARPEAHSQAGFPFGLVGLASIPILLFVLPILMILALKRRRRARRRRAPTPALQITGGWDELVDYLRDLGRPVPARATRRELASVSAADGLSEVAIRVDESIFGAPEPSESDVRGVWNQVAETRRRVAGSLGRMDRVRCALSLTSLRAQR